MKKKIFLLTFIIGLFFPLSGLLAGSFPYDAKTIYHELEGIGNSILLASSTRTILGLSIQQSGVASLSYIRCNGDIVAKNYAKDLPFNQISYLCNGNISVDKTGQDSASFLITYVNYNLASSTLYASSSPLFMSNNIENISYIATTTITNAGTSITQGTYYIPFILLKFILAILVLSILSILILYILKRRQ